MSSNKRESDESFYFESQSSSEYDFKILRSNEDTRRVSRHLGRTLHIAFLYFVIGLLVAFESFKISSRNSICENPALSLYSPANEAVSYKTVTFNPYFFDPSPWTRGSKEEKDSLWESLYDFGISGISEEEASHLLNATLPAPHDPNTYLIQLEVFHNLHCLNMLRMTLYPDQYPEMVAYHENGTINHGTLQAQHMDHCIDALRQSTMCEADVTPVTFARNFFGRGVYPKLEATHTCRDFDRIAEWAKKREVKNYEAN